MRKEYGDEETLRLLPTELEEGVEESFRTLVRESLHLDSWGPDVVRA